MTKFHLLIFILAAHCALAQTRQLCVTVDDLPTVAYGADNHAEITRKLFDREIPQVLLIHASLLNADYLNELAEMYQRNGYAFVSLPAALQDAAYQEKITKFGNYGISWIDRWALSRGVPKEFFAGDPATPAYIEEVGK